MSDYPLTKAQSAIINSAADKILVSASAGTGKTFVMVERIINLLTEKNCDIDEFLVVTFTKAAAEEMRGRIYGALKNGLSTSPQLKKQLTKLPTASISTLHSFCSDLIKRYFYAADMPPRFKVIDETKATVMKKEVLDDLLDELYEKGDDDFLRLSDILAPKRRDDNLIETVIKLYGFSQSLEDPEGFLRSAKKLKSKETYLAELSKDLELYLKDSLERFSALYAELSSDGFSKSVEMTGKIVGAINNALRKTNPLDRLDLLFEELGLDKKAESPFEKKVGKTASYESFLSLRKDFYAKIKEYLEWKELANDNAAFDAVEKDVSTLCDLILLFSERYRAEKDKFSCLDFSDLEHYALKLLSFDEVVKDIREKYRYVFVDEYQDTSKVQEALLSAISSGNNLFVVGDLKQSIYGFRQCDMSIFADKEHSYGKTVDGEVFYLNTNFRSGGTILKFVNEVFSVLMTESVGINYAETSVFESLRKDFGEVELDVINVKKERENAKPEIYSVLKDDDTDGDLKAGEIEGKFIASKIKALVGKDFFDGKTVRKCEFGDICVLSRDLSSAKANSLYKAIFNEGIPVSSSSAGTNLFDCAEVVQAASFIKLLQNYKDDIPLLSVLKSPFFGFGDEELSKIRRGNMTAKFFHEALLSAKTQGELCEKVNGFFETLSFYKNVALARGGIFALKKAICKTPFECAVLAKFNGQKKLDMVNDFISKLSAISEDGNLAGLIAAIDLLDNNLKASDTISGDGAVSFMTIHKSKGLEFPIVFLSNLAKKPHGVSDFALPDKDLGVGIKFYDTKKRQKKNSLPYRAILLKKKKESAEEELRVLYVAMTRAKSKLFLTSINACSDESPTSLAELFADKANRDASSQSELLEIVGKALLEKNTFATINFVDFSNETPLSEEDFSSLSSRYEKTERAISEQLSYSYPRLADLSLPTKFVASNLKREYFVEEEVSYKLPDIYSDDRLLLGTAYHRLLEKSMPLATKEKILSCLDELVSSGEITPETKARIDVDAVFRTLNLPVMSFGKAYVEKPFMLKAPAKLFTEYPSETEILVQGVIDLLLVNGNDAVVIDFKYTSEKNENILKKRYAPQLSAYSYAVERATGLSVVKKAVLNLRSFDLIEL